MKTVSSCVLPVMMSWWYSAMTMRGLLAGAGGLAGGGGLAGWAGRISQCRRCYRQTKAATSPTVLNVPLVSMAAWTCSWTSEATSRQGRATWA
jgi:hypothetical protein